MATLATQEKQVPTLSSLIESNHPNLKLLSKIEDLPEKKNLIITVGAAWCHHCQSEFKNVLNPVCKDLKATNCGAIDGDSDTGRKLMQDIGINPTGFPYNIFCTYNEKNKRSECVPIPGALPKESFKEILSKLKLT